MTRGIVTPTITTPSGAVIYLAGLNRYVFVIKQTPARVVVRDYGRELEFFWDEQRKGYFSSTGDFFSAG